MRSSQSQPCAETGPVARPGPEAEEPAACALCDSARRCTFACVGSVSLAGQAGSDADRLLGEARALLRRCAVLLDQDWDEETIATQAHKIVHGLWKKRDTR